MHIALLANTAWLDEELPLFQHLVVGLIDEQARVAQVVPEGRLSQEASVFGEIAYWRDEGYAWRRRHSLLQLGDVLDGLGVNLIHALDGRLWRAAAELGRRNDVPVVYSCFAKPDLLIAGKLATKLDPTRAVFTAASHPLHQALLQALPEGFEASMFRTGVHRLPQEEPSGAEIVSIAVAGSGELDDAAQALLQGAAAMVHDYPQTHLFFDGRGVSQRQLWRATEKLGLLNHATFVPRRLGHRELLLRADVLVHPQATGCLRGITLEAMAHGLPIIAHHDPVNDDLIDTRTARVLSQPSADDWFQALSELVASAERRRALGASARQWVQEHRLASTSVAQALHIYRTLTGQTLAFSA